LLVLMVMVGLGIVGFADDYIKIRKQRNLGLSARTKFIGQLAVALAFGLLAVRFRNADGYLPGSTELSWVRDLTFSVGTIGFPVLAWLMISATSNAVNLTDGLDGLAAGATAFSASCLGLIGYWEYRHALYQVADALDLALAAIAIAGACVGFLWWNAAPARIFMGDTGSLALGTGLACIALELNIALLLPIIGGLFVLETLSVILQVIMFRGFHRRIFRMAPLHHHFELLGWPETTVIIRFWILGALCSALALGVFYADFLSLPKV
jgi:phospho-N-acetylmuramoyl-pentapeptide-transferase